MHEEFIKNEASCPYIDLARIQFDTKVLLWRLVKGRGYILGVLSVLFGDMILFILSCKAEVDDFKHAVFV